MSKLEKLTDNEIVLSDLSQLIDTAKRNIALSVNAEINLLYWQIGKRIKEEILQAEKPGYGKRIIENLGKSLSEKCGKGYSKTNLFNWLKLFEIFQDENIFHALRGKLTWTHLRTMIYIEDPIKREFYIEICSLERWSTRQLDERINSMLYERTAISKKPEETIRKDLQQLRDEQKVSPELVFRDPYFLDFLGLKDTYSEKDLETAIIAELQR